MSDFQLNQLCEKVAVLDEFRLEEEKIDMSGKLKVLDRLLKIKSKQVGLFAPDQNNPAELTWQNLGRPCVDL